MARFLYAFIAVLAFASLSACTQTPLPAERPDITFSHLEPIKLDVARIQVVSDYQPPLKEPNVEHRFSPAPADVLRRWAADRLRAVGDTGTATFIIREASVVEVPVKHDEGVKGLFKTEVSERYKAEAEVMVRAESRTPTTTRSAHATARATREKTVLENISLAEREDAWFRMTEALMADLNAELEDNIRTHLASFVVR